MSEMIDPTPEQAGRTSKRKSSFALLLLVCIIGTVLSYGYWRFFMRNRVYTDNAYVMADSSAVSSRVAGTISRIAVENDDTVGAGEVLIELDPRDFKAEVEKQRGALTRTEADIRMAEVTVRLTERLTKAQLQMAQATAQVAQEKEQEAQCRLNEMQRNRSAVEAEFGSTKRDYERYVNLNQQGAISEQQRDKTVTAFKKTKAQFEASDAQIAAARAQVAAALQEIDRTKAQIEASKADQLRVEVERNKLESLKAKRIETLAELETAELNLSYCTIKAAISGYVAQKRIQVGDRIQPGQPLFAIVPLQDVYVEANFKETQLRDVRIGQPVEIKADIYPGVTYHGRVAGIRAGTGAAFSLLPAENATGNWIKIVQRIPVKIRLDASPPPEHPLRVGSSLGVTISTADRSGPTLRMTKSQIEKQVKSVR